MIEEARRTRAARRQQAGQDMHDGPAPKGEPVSRETTSRYFCTMKFSRSRRMAALGLAPTIVLATSPPWYTLSVGIDITPYFAAVAGFSSMFSLTISMSSPYSAAMASSEGAIWRHGPHQAAQKSTSTGLSFL